jgi:uracil-DNA glycosylase
MTHRFDPGYTQEPFRTLCENYPDESVYPPKDFRVEWGPIFHRGRLDGSARILVIGQDPAAHESIARRILVGEAGQRFQGFLAKLGIEKSYVMVNTFLYSVYGQGGGEKHKNDPAIAQYRNRWIDALVLGKSVEAVVALGSLADAAWNAWKATPSGQGTNLTYAKITHPTQPESSGGGKAAIKAMLENWNAGLHILKPAVTHPDVSSPLVPYGTVFAPGEKPDIPEADMPAGLPGWMHGEKNWANRSGTTAKAKRATIVVTVPDSFLP